MEYVIEIEWYSEVTRMHHRSQYSSQEEQMQYYKKQREARERQRRRQQAKRKVLLIMIVLAALLLVLLVKGCGTLCNNSDTSASSDADTHPVQAEWVTAGAMTFKG